MENKEHSVCAFFDPQSGECHERGVGSYPSLAEYIKDTKSAYDFPRGDFPVGRGNKLVEIGNSRSFCGGRLRWGETRGEYQSTCSAYSTERPDPRFFYYNVM